MEINRKLKKVIIVFLCIIIVLLTSFIIKNAFKQEKNKTFEEAKIESSQIAKQEEKQRIENTNKNTQEKIDEKIGDKTKRNSYKIYDNLTSKEKEKTEVIPREEIIPIDSLDEIKDNKDNGEIPSKFNLKDIIKIKVEDQKNRGLCWDFASVKSLETFLALRGKEYNFSKQHVNYITSNLLYGGRAVDEGGSFGLFQDYLIESGPVLEEDIPYSKNYNEDEYSKFTDMDPIINVTDTVDFPTIDKINKNYTDEQLAEFRKTVKKHIMKNGSLYAEIITPVVSHNFDAYNFSEYNDKIPEDNFSLHAVSIVGWDDNYSKDNFNFPFNSDSKPQHDGAYIALNSWGESFSGGGYFYISYDDIMVEESMSGISSVDMDATVELSNIKNKILRNYIKNTYNYALLKKNGKDYIPNILLKRISYLNLSNMNLDNLDGIEYFTNVSSIDISNNNLTDISVLSKLTKLYSINAENNQIKNVSSLSNLNNLMTINISKNNNVSGYSKLTNLENLIIDNSNITQLEDISNINLYGLSLQDNANITINNLPKSLVYLNLENDNLSDISFLNNSKIYDLNLKNNDLTDLNIISKINCLNYLDISNNNITDFTSINNIKCENENNEFQEFTKEIDLNNNQIDMGLSTLILSNSNINDISKLNNIHTYYLDLSNNDLKEISNFNPSEKLVELDLSNNNIKDVSSLYSSNINRLYLNKNKDVKGYSRLNKLEYLSLNECNISSLENISSLDNLNGISLNNNNLKDITDIGVLKQLSSIELNDNKSEITGTINNEKINTMSIKNSNYQGLNISSPINHIIVSKNNYKILNNIITSPDEYSSAQYNSDGEKIKIDELNNLITSFNETKFNNVSINNIELNIDVKVKDNEIDLSDNKLLYKALYNHDYKIADDYGYISKNRKKIYLKSDDVNIIEIGTIYNNDYIYFPLGPKQYIYGSKIILNIIK